jgi:hypothetical protein
VLTTKPRKMTINQALDKLIDRTDLNLEQQNLKFSLVNFKMEFGGNTKIENNKQVKNIIKYGNKEGEPS